MKNNFLLAKAGLIFGAIGFVGPFLMLMILYGLWIDRPLPPAEQLNLRYLIVYIFLIVFSLSALAGIVLGIISLKSLEKSNNPAKDRVRAIAGIILGSLILIVLAILFYLACTITVGSGRGGG